MQRLIGRLISQFFGRVALFYALVKHNKSINECNNKAIKKIRRIESYLQQDIFLIHMTLINGHNIEIHTKTIANKAIIFISTTIFK